MPRIIRRALYQKLRELPELLEFQRDFELLSGMKLAFVNELGLGDDLRRDRLPLCAAMNASEAGRAMCARSRHALLANTGDHSSCMVCDAGLSEAAVPLNISGIKAGYFMFGGTAPLPPNQPTIQKARHLLKKNGIHIDDRDLETWLSQTPVMPAETLDAYKRIVHLAAKQIALKVTDQLVDPEVAMPPSVVKACGYIRSRALVDDINLAEVARHCCVSEGHLSRIFHHATGLTFREYLTQVRIERAKSLLLNSGKSVTEIAYESGFQSLSQFHRVFRKIHGVSPGEMRSKTAQSPITRTR
jgi:AraC-like DNA-binding protein/ligand-binding sensor protein